MGFNFPDAPAIGQVFTGYVWNGESWQVQGGPRSGLSSVKKNYIINGAMMVSQENGATAGTASGYYPVDMFLTLITSSGTATSQQIASSTPAGSPNRLRVTATVADASVAAGDNVNIVHTIEGLRVADLRFGSSSAKTVTIQFGVKAPAGTYGVSLSNYAGNRCYVSEYTIAAGQANTDTVVAVTISGDTAGTWVTDNNSSFTLRWTLMTGTTYQQAAGAWGTTPYAMGTSNQFNFMGTVGNVFELFDVSLTEGTVAPPFVVPDIVSELALCRRYWQRNDGVGPALANGSTILYNWTFQFPVPMRAAPTVSISNTLNGTTPSAPLVALSISSSGSSPWAWNVNLNLNASLPANAAVLTGGGHALANARL